MGLFGNRKKKNAASCAAVILCAGESARMGFDKMLAEVGGVPVAVRSIRAFQDLDCVGEIVVVAREDLVPELARLCQEYGLSKVTKVVRGGANRTQSARLGTLEVSARAPLIAIHDGARPFVSAQVIQDAVEQAGRSGAAVPVVPVKDTVKRVRNAVVEETLDREELFAAQTPQVFDADLIRAALQKALDDGAALTDDCAAVERLGMKAVVTAGDERNIKLTTPADLAAAEAMAEELAK